MAVDREFENIFWGPHDLGPGTTRPWAQDLGLGTGAMGPGPWAQDCGPGPGTMGPGPGTMGPGLEAGPRPGTMGLDYHKSTTVQ